MVWWLPHSKRVPGFCVESHVLPVYVWVLCGYSGFLPPSKKLHVSLIRISKLFIGVSVSVCGCLSHLSLCDSVMDWRPVQGVPRLSPNDS